MNKKKGRKGEAKKKENWAYWEEAWEEDELEELQREIEMDEAW